MFSKITNSNPVSGTDIFWYLDILRHGLKIWFLFLVPAIIYAFFERRKNKKISFIIAWFFAPLILLTMARMKNDWYLIMIYPAAALMIGIFVSRLGKNLNDNTLLGLIVIIASFNLFRYQSSYFFPETVAAEVKLARRARELTLEDESILLDDNYLPVAVFYSNREVTPLRFSRAYESFVGEETLKEATFGAKRKLVLTNSQTLNQLIESFHEKDYAIVVEADDKMLLELLF